MSGAVADPDRKKNFWTRIPLSLRIIIGVCLGVGTGIALGKVNGEPWGPICDPLGQICMLLITLLKTLATPLILFAVLDAFLHTEIPLRKGGMLVGISFINACVAIVIGLGISNTLRLGEGYQEMFSNKLSMAAKKKVEKPDESKSTETTDAKKKEPSQAVKAITSFVPENVIDPFQKNNVITVVFLAVLAGASLRRLKRNRSPEIIQGLKYVESIVHVIFKVFTQIVEWVIEIIPFAVFGVVAQVVGATGLEVFHLLGAFLATVLIGLFIHAVIYYSIILTAVGRTSPFKFYSGAFDSITTALSCGSSLATLPVTLRCLNDNLKISPASARLAACVGTNLNHAGIILYEAAAVIFISQALGMHLSYASQLNVAMASVLAGVGIAGVPEAGLMTLSLALVAGGIPAETVAIVAPLVLPVDWIIGRCRAATNVISDMTVATLLDRLDPTPEAAQPTLSPIAEPESVKV